VQHFEIKKSVNQKRDDTHADSDNRPSIINIDCEYGLHQQRTWYNHHQSNDSERTKKQVPTALASSRPPEHPVVAEPEINRHGNKKT